MCLPFFLHLNFIGKSYPLRIQLSIRQNIFVPSLGMPRDCSIQYLQVFAEISTEFIINLTSSPPSTTTLMRMSDMVSADPYWTRENVCKQTPAQFSAKEWTWGKDYFSSFFSKLPKLALAFLQTAKEDNVFRSVCHSVYRGMGVRQTPSRCRPPWRQTPLPRYWHLLPTFFLYNFKWK